MKTVKRPTFEVAYHYLLNSNETASVAINNFQQKLLTGSLFSIKVKNPKGSAHLPVYEGNLKFFGLNVLGLIELKPHELSVVGCKNISESKERLNKRFKDYIETEVEFYKGNQITSSPSLNGSKSCESSSDEESEPRKGYILKNPMNMLHNNHLFSPLLLGIEKVKRQTYFFCNKEQLILVFGPDWINVMNNIVNRLSNGEVSWNGYNENEPHIQTYEDKKTSKFAPFTILMDPNEEMASKYVDEISSHVILVFLYVNNSIPVSVHKYVTQTNKTLI